MPSVVPTLGQQSSPPSNNTAKKSFATVLGFGSAFRYNSDTDSDSQPAVDQTRGEILHRNHVPPPQTINTTETYTTASAHKTGPGRFSVTNLSFERVPRSAKHTPSNSIPPNAQAPDLTFDTMKALDTNLPTSSRRGPIRMDTQDGPWSVSVAETPYDTRGYCLYIKTPTHNLTLTRTAMELVELDLKLRQSHSNVKIPTLPINPESLPVPPKRKSNFLNTLSRLASPTSTKSNRQSSLSRRGTTTTPPSALPTPRIPTSIETNDPFGSFTSSNGNGEEGESVPVVTASATSTAIAAYLTTVSNTPALRMDRVWKRFVRVRTDDLESQRADKPIKRVRSDLAAHLGNLGKEKEGVMLKENHRLNNLLSHHVRAGTPAGAHGGSAVPADEKDSLIEETMTVDFEGHVPKDAVTVKEDSIAENQPDETFLPSDAPPDSTVPATQLPPASNEVLQTPVSLSSQDGKNENDDGGGEDRLPSTPVTSTSTSEPHRLHRSQSAEPDKSHRVPRGYASSVQSQTCDEESSSSAAMVQNGHIRRRKKRSASSVPKEPKKSQRKVVIDDFEMMRVLGKGCAGKVLLVRHKMTSDLFALKAITKRHVLAHQELQHTLTEQAVLKRMAAESRDPFVVKLWWSFHDKENLFLVMDFHPGGDLATQLARWGRLGRDRARFYAAEIVEGVEGLHAAGVIYRDLKPENILIGADGHIVLTDFGLSKEFPRWHCAAPIRAAGEFYSSVPGTPQQPTSPPWMTPDRSGDLSLGWPGQPIGHTDSTTTFCGTAEYLAPEVIQGFPYSYEVDWWSFGTMLYEMLTGITPFWADNHSDMYVRVLQDELQFPDDRAIDQDTKSLIRGLLQRVPTLRICEPRIKKHPYFSMIDWSHVYYKRYIPPYIPPIDPSNASDTQNFDDTFLDMEPVLDDYNESEAMDTDQEPQTDTDRTDGEDSNTTPSQSRSSSIRPQPQMPMEYDMDVFDGYSFKGRHSVLIDDGDEEEESEEGSEEESIAETDNISSILGSLEQQAAEIDSTSQLLDDMVQEETVEPKTPEARPAALPPAGDIPVVPAQPPVVEEIVEAVGQPVKDEEPVQPEASKADETRPKETNGRLTPPPPPPNTSKPLPARQLVPNRGRPRREKSGVPALDRYLSDAIDEDTEATEAERDEDDDWDFIEAADGEDRNGTKGTSLFARGVVDRYRLAVFRKAATPSRPTAQRSASGISAASSSTEITEHPSPSQRRGRQGLAFRKRPRQFLRPKSPPSSFSAKSSITARSISHSVSASNTLSAASLSSNGMLTPSLSVGSTFAMSPSLKSKESATSVGARSQSSDQSGKDTSTVFVDAPDTKASLQSPEPEKGKTKKLKKYKNNAEKVFSLFSSPRQQTS